MKAPSEIPDTARRARTASEPNGLRGSLQRGRPPVIPSTDSGRRGAGLPLVISLVLAQPGGSMNRDEVGDQCSSTRGDSRESRESRRELADQDLTLAARRRDPLFRAMRLALCIDADSSLPR